MRSWMDQYLLLRLLLRLLLLLWCSTAPPASCTLSLLTLPWHNWYKVVWHLGSTRPNASKHLLLIAKASRLHRTRT